MEAKKKLTREEALRRLAESKRKKVACTERMKEYLRIEYKRLTGEEPTYIEVW